jgi:two-component system, NarL family, invasion response regulator UvrY
MTSVLIIDDHPIVLQGCRRMLEDAGVKTVLEARDVTSGYRLYRRHHPDVAIVDLAMQGGGLGGLDVIRRMRSHEPRTRILVFSMYSDPIVAARALEAGATGYVLKDTSSDELMKAFDQVRTGTPYLAMISPCRLPWCARACGQIRSPTLLRANCRRCPC